MEPRLEATRQRLEQGGGRQASSEQSRDGRGHASRGYAAAIPDDQEVAASRTAGDGSSTLKVFNRRASDQTVVPPVQYQRRCRLNLSPPRSLAPADVHNVFMAPVFVGHRIQIVVPPPGSESHLVSHRTKWRADRAFW
jgi:hypothetical protein